jgi:probable F420-dependent oxidoreductase
VLLGFAVPTAGSWATPDNQVELAQRAEELGYASLWTFQRLLYPADPQRSAAPRRWQPVYRSVHDPLITLAYLAGVTSRVRLGVAVLNYPWYSPLLLAKMATTLDTVSRGRLDLGLGLGWAQEEFAATATSPGRRGALAEEFLATLEAVWTQDVVEHQGELGSFSDVRVEPKPTQRPRPPLLLGGTAEPALRRAGRAADGWISSSGHDLRTIGASIATVRTGAVEAGKDPDALRFVCRGVVRVRRDGGSGRATGAGGPDGPDRLPLSGGYDDIRADLATIAAQGVTETFVDLNFDAQIGTVDADPAASMQRAHEVLTELAPGAS